MEHPKKPQPRATCQECGIALIVAIMAGLYAAGFGLSGWLAAALGVNVWLLGVLAIIKWRGPDA